MENELFINNTQQKAFYNLIAARKYYYSNKEKQSYETDIAEYLQKCDEIFKENNARCDFISEILARKDVAPKNEIYRGNNNLSEIDSLTKEFIDFLKTIPLNVKEDLEFYSKLIDDRLQRITNISLELKSILEQYSNVDNLDYNETFEILSPIFENISLIKLDKELKLDQNLYNKEDLDFIKTEISSIINDGVPKINEEISFEEEKFLNKEIENKVEESLNRHEVIGIKHLPINKIDYEEEPNIEKPELNPFDKTDKAVAEIEFEKKNQLDSESRFVPETNFDFTDLENEGENTPNEITELREKPTIPLDNIIPMPNNKPKIKEKDMVQFEMPKGISLIEIAVTLCGDSKGWFDIYELNKDAFNKIVKEKNKGNFENIENDGGLFAGLTIKIPTMFKKAAPESYLKAA